MTASSRSSLIWLLLATTVGGTGLVMWGRALPSNTSTPKRSAGAFPTQELQKLDQVVQARFAIVPKDGTFGYSRITIPTQVHAHFYPSTPKERSIVTALKNSGTDVVFFLGGSKQFQGRIFGKERVRGPVLLTSAGFTNGQQLTSRQMQDKIDKENETLLKNAPKAAALEELTDEVLANPQKARETGIEVNGWRVVARPIEASVSRCVTCHNSLAKPQAKSSLFKEAPETISLHDPLGVALYCFRKEAGKVSKGQPHG